MTIDQDDVPTVANGQVEVVPLMRGTLRTTAPDAKATGLDLGEDLIRSHAASDAGSSQTRRSGSRSDSAS
jgi:hypothetical protein